MSNLYPCYNRAPHRFVKGSGPYLWNETGARFFDFGSGIGVNALGHAPKNLAAILTEQAAQLWHVSNLYEIPGQVELSDFLCAHSFAESVFFTNSGTEAIDCAIKTARRFHYDNADPRHKIITFEGCFHGRSLGAISTTTAPKMIEGFGPMLEGFIQVSPDPKSLSAVLDHSVAAILIEPIQGEGGIRVMSDAFLRHLRTEADRVGALLIFDEIQCGMGRTGKLFAYEYSGVTPDIMTLAKGIGGGFPLGACLAREHVGRAMVPGTHGSTYGGNPLAMRIGIEMLKTMTAPEFLTHVNALAVRIQQALGSFIDAYPDLFEELRGEGLMLGLKCKFDPALIVKTGRENGVLLVPASDQVVRLLPPLNLSFDELEEGLKLLEITAQKTRSLL